MTAKEKEVAENFRKAIKNTLFRLGKDWPYLTADQIDIIFEKNGIKTGVNLKGRCQNE